MAQNDYSIWVVEYARVREQFSEAIYSGYARVGARITMPFTFIVVSGHGKNILIDCGIDFSSPVKREMAAAFGVELGRSPSEVLARVGLQPADIDIIIPTHAHWDHMGALRLFPNATVYVQRGERDGWRTLFGESARYAALLSAMDKDDIEVLDELERDGRLDLLEGEMRDLLPGLHIWTDLNGHSHASQLVLIESEYAETRDHYIAIGDVAYSMDNLTGVPEYPHFIPNTKWAIGGAYSTMRTYERILEYVGEEHHRVLIEHDVRTWERYPTAEFADGLHVAEVRLASGEASRLPRAGGKEESAR